VQIVPHDNGLWQHDVILNHEQANALVEHIEMLGSQVPIKPGDFEMEMKFFNSATPPPNTTDTVHRAKRFALYLEQNAGARWDKMPIPVLFEDAFSRLHRIYRPYEHTFFFQVTHRRPSSAAHSRTSNLKRAFVFRSSRISLLTTVWRTYITRRNHLPHCESALHDWMH
jgi:hypothetical protein